MAYEFKDMETIVVNADLLTLCEPDQFIETPKRQTGFKNLLWWLRCYPNGNTEKEKDHVSVFICTSTGGIFAAWAMTIDRSNIECFSKFCTIVRQNRVIMDEQYEFFDQPMNNGSPKLASHAELQSGSIIENGVFVIRCKVNFKVNLDEISNDILTVEDTCIIKLKRKSIETCQPGQDKVTNKQKLDDTTWWIQYYPGGYRDDHKDYISVYFYTIGAPIKIKYSCGMSIGGTLIQKYSIGDADPHGLGIGKWFSHKQCQSADHNDGTISLVCKVELIKSVETIPPTLNLDETDFVDSGRKIRATDSAALTILECQLEMNEVGDFDSTDKKFVEESGKHQWRLIIHPNGDTQRSFGHISLIVDASTTETEPVILSGVIKIDGTPFEKKFNMFVEKDSNLAFAKLISHEELRRIGGIIDSQITITCDACFETQLFVI